MNVVLADDDRLVCESLKVILEAAGDIAVIGVGNSGEEAIRLADEKRPDVLLMDIRMGGMSGLEAGERILVAQPDARILYLTTFLDDEYIVRALRIGAKGYILKQKFECIVPALRAVSLGQSVFGDEIVGKLPDLLHRGGGFDYSAHGVSRKEQEMITLVAQGMSNREIAETLYLSEGTVRNYLSAVLEKLGLRDRTQLAVFYFQHQ